MHERAMQEQIRYQLVEMEMAGHEEMESANICQVYATHLQDKCCKKGYQINDQQILCDGSYAEHHMICNLLISIIL